MNILITGARSPYTLHLSRLLAKFDNNIYTVDSIENNLCKNSKYVKKNFLSPKPRQETKDYIFFLKKIISDNDIKLLIPTCEEVYYVSKYVNELPCEVFTSNIDTLTILHSKYKFIKLLNDLNIKAPKTTLITNKNELYSHLTNQNKFVLKPEYSRFASKTIINNKTPQVISKININNENKWVFQEFIKGQQYCSYSLVRNGVITAHCNYTSKYFAGIGSTIYFESIKEDKILEIVSKIVKKLNYTGQISFDFIKSQENNTFYPIECNPRTTSGITLFTSEDDIFSAFIKENIFIEPKSDNPKMYLIAMLLYELPKFRNYFKFFSDFFRAKDVIYDKNDFIPFLNQFFIIKDYYNLAKKLNISILEASTVDIEWNGKWD
jgi:predicted ATP-grasp superfamily ATP-dependent carboligase